MHVRREAEAEEAHLLYLRVYLTTSLFGSSFFWPSTTHLDLYMCYVIFVLISSCQTTYVVM